MQVFYVDVDSGFQVRMLECVYEDMRLFSLQTKVDDTAEDFDMDEYMEEYLFYRGVMSHDARTNEVQMYRFAEPRVFQISEGRHVSVFFYLTCSEDGLVTHCYRKNVRNGDCEYICSWDRSEVQGEVEVYPGAWIDTLAVSRFYTLDEHHALVVFHLTGERRLRFALIDAVQKKWMELEPPAFFQAIESMTYYRASEQTWAFVKIGEHMLHERQQMWENGEEQMPEQCMMIKVDRLVEMLKCGEHDWAAHLFFSSQPHQALLDMVWRDDRALLLIREFNTGHSVLVEYDCQHGTTTQRLLDTAYDRLYVWDHSLYAVYEDEGYTKLSNIEKNTEWKLDTGSRRIIDVVDHGVLTTDITMLAEDQALYIHTYDHAKADVLVQGEYFIDDERQLILSIEQS